MLILACVCVLPCIVSDEQEEYLTKQFKKESSDMTLNGTLNEEAFKRCLRSWQVPAAFAHVLFRGFDLYGPS